MKVFFSAIPDEGLLIPFTEKDSAWEGLRDVSFESLPRGELSVGKIGRDVFIKGTFSAVANFSCSRCLEAFPHSLDISFQHTLRPLNKEVQKIREQELIPEDLEYGYYEEDVILLDQLIEEHLLFAVPMKPLCTETCRGLCSLCGINKNKDDCSCSKKEKDSPFDNLKHFIT